MAQLLLQSLSLVLSLPLRFECECFILEREYPQMGAGRWAVAEADHDAMLGIDIHISRLLL